MAEFLKIELPIIFVSLFVLAIIVFIGTRSFVSPLVLRRGLPLTAVFLSVAIYTHYSVVKSRIEEVTKAFLDNKIILCSERRSKMGDRNIEVVKGDLWRLDEGFFVSAGGDKFSIGQCLVK